MKGFFVCAGSVLAMAGAGWAVSGLGPTINPPQPPPGLEAHESHASASLLGEFRTNASAWLWVRTDLYLHNGVQMRPMTEAERRNGVTAGAPTNDGHEALSDESAIVTVVPPKERDFRGLFGDVERATDAYKEMRGHNHNDPRMAMPLFRLMTWIDPQFVPGWTTGAMVLSRDPGKAAQFRAVAYLKDGLKENPKSLSILSDLGRLTATHLGDLPAASRYFERAIDLGAGKMKELSDGEIDGLRQSFRWLGICLRDMGKASERDAILDKGLALFPDDLVLIELRYPPPSIYTREGATDWLQKKAEEIRAERR